MNNNQKIIGTILVLMLVLVSIATYQIYTYGQATIPIRWRANLLTLRQPVWNMMILVIVTWVILFSTIMLALKEPKKTIKKG